jgi:hypothetical protein
LARKTIFVSDISGKEISEKASAKVTITYSDARRGQIVLDVNANEVAEWRRRRRSRSGRGRRPKNR